MAWAAPIAASVIGGMMSKSGSKGSTQQTQTAEPWSGVQPHLRSLYDSAASNFAQGPQQYYPGQTVAPQGGVTEQAQQGLYSRATQGNPLLPGAQGQADATLNDEYMWNNPAMLGQLGMGFGDTSTQGMDQLSEIGGGSMLGSNPYLDSMFNNAADRVGQQFSKHVMPGVTSGFEGAGRYGSNAHQESMRGYQQAFGDTLGKMAGDIYGQDYGRERGFQQQALGQLGQFDLAGRGLAQQALSDAGTMFGRERVMQGQAAQMSPQLSQADYFDIAQLMGLGGQQDQYSQSLIDADKNRWDFNQQAPNDMLSFFNSILSGASDYKGGTTNGSTQSPYSPLAGMLGGARLGSMFAPQPATSGFGGGGFGAGVNPNTGEFMGSLEF